MIWANIIIACCAASWVRFNTQLWTEQLWHWEEACQFKRDLHWQVRFTESGVSLTLKSQRTNHPTYGCCCTQSTFPSVCSQLCLSYCWGHEVWPRRRSSVQPDLAFAALIHTQFTGLNFCYHKVFEFKFSSAAWNHYELITLYGSPQSLQEKM